MIPKIIHYVWFGGEKPKSVSDCIESWKQCCPDYEIMEWNEKNVNICSCSFLQEALALKKYAFASDVIRLAVLFEYGGVYLDTDVKLLKTFDPFLNNKSFIGKELPLRLSTAVIGAEPGLQWIKDFLYSYTIKGKHFISKSGKIDQTVNTILISDFINNTWYKFNKDISIYSEDFFCCKSFFTKEIIITDNTVAIHDFSYSWANQEGFRLLDRLKNIYLRFKVRFELIFQN